MKKYVIIILASLALVACGPTPTAGIPSLDNVTGQPAPAVQNGGFDVGSAAIGALGGAVVGNMMGKASQPQHVVVHRPVYAAPSYYGRSTVTTTTTRRSLLGNRTVTRRR